MARANSTTRLRLAWTAPTVGLTHATANLASRIPSRVHQGGCTRVPRCTRSATAGVQRHMDFLKQWGVGMAAFIAIDFLWIGVVANGFYRRAIGPLLRMDGDRMD